METLWLMIIFVGAFSEARFGPQPLPNIITLYEDGVNVEPGCEKEGRMVGLKENKVVRENDVLKIVRICGNSEKKVGSRPPEG